MTKKPQLKGGGIDDTIHVASSCEMTGLEPVPPLTEEEEDAYASLGGAPCRAEEESV